MDVGKLFSGIAVIIDDEINEDSSPISTMKKTIEKRDIPVATYETIPEKGVIPSLVDAAFVILDWDFTHGQAQRLLDGDEERIKFGDTMQKDQESELIEFIRALMLGTFVPVFIFTAKEKEGVTRKLLEAELWDNNKPNRIFVKEKSEMRSEEELFGAIEGWIKSMPSAYVLKEWGKVVSDAKRDMFLRMYKCSPDWAKVVWDMLKDDSETDCSHEFGEFMTRICVNSINEYSFDESLLSAVSPISSAELAGVIEGEHYSKYAEQPKRAYTGDLFKKDEEYYLNMRAPCDLARDNNPTLYCIKGKKLAGITEDIRLTAEGEMVFSATDRISLDELSGICRSDGGRREEFNGKLREHRDGVFFNKGEILEKKLEVIVPCVAGEKAIKFRIELKPIKFGELKSYRVGRVLPPYITRIQQKCAQTIFREGVMPIPGRLFSDSEE
jgi:hypothetical protein